MSESQNNKWLWPLIWSDERGGWWRLTVVAFSFAFAFMVAAVLRAALIEPAGFLDTLAKGSTIRFSVVWLFALMIPICVATAGMLLVIRIVHGKSVRSLLTDGRKFNFGLGVQSAFVWGFVFIIGFIALPGGWEKLLDRLAQHSMIVWLKLFIPALCIILVQSTCEEIQHRGYLQSRIGAWVKKPWIAICISTLLFTLVHDHAPPAAKFKIAALGLIFGISAVRAGTLSAPIAMHAAHNTLASLLLHAHKDITWLDALLTIPQAGLWLVWLFWTTRPRAATERSSKFNPQGRLVIGS